MVLQVLRWK